MRKTRTIIAAASLGAATLALAACDSQPENEVEQQAEAIDETAEAQANEMEAFAEGAPDEEQVDVAADQVREEGEDTKDNLEDAADEMDTTPQ